MCQGPDAEPRATIPASLALPQSNRIGPGARAALEDTVRRVSLVCESVADGSLAQSPEPPENPGRFTTGVVANVVTYLTGATHDTGFKGLGGKFDRRGLHFFGTDIENHMRFTRVDSGAAVGVSVRLDGLPFDPRARALMPRSLAGTATADDARLFGSLWQDRVRALVVDHAADPNVVVRH